jgi:hypothetical protein
MRNINNSVFYESARGAREEQEVKDLKYKIILLQENLKKTIKAKENIKSKKDCDVIDQTINNFKSQIEVFEKRIKKIIITNNA